MKLFNTFTLLLGFRQVFNNFFWESLIYLYHVEILKWSQVQGLILTKAPQFVTGTSIAQQPMKFSFKSVNAIHNYDIICLSEAHSKFFNNREPLYIDNKVNTMIQEKNKIYHLYLKSESNISATKPWRPWICETLESCKSKYYENISKICSKVITPKYIK